uniref:Uncharacterized protein n=1 Tax=Panagrolaimus superbus TaxID=310955 RepID=A0A914XVU9_9BILA
MLSLVQTSRVKANPSSRPHQLPISGSTTSKKSSVSSSTAGTMATAGSSNGSQAGSTPQMIRRMPSFGNAKEQNITTGSHNEMGVDVGNVQ